ncbi:hypothetical protein CC1G_08890 [Coprinopsis cinerea okayama7|uniref:Uncharacterized protein n=1 Tax=Coprinopsis cinerea (strain Okayama-7 / 130 / ATCC MYA-4618 / FGSC 9003) TaxID=240176 RepID=A8P871_COPC7|nr:hypothetical protein CC1G_08890 [Coprinopsis cinerea okayama7\|eukprot:XP_001839511.2 hypothetical protein CC1G_08890 [Coprinopsis cinerea okayama7\
MEWSVKEPYGRCVGTAQTHYPRYVYLVVFLSEAVTIGLTLVKACQHIRRSNSSWVSQLYKNGILYSICVLLFSLLNVIFPFTTSPVYAGLFVRPQRVAESVLCNRVVFVILRQQNAQRRLRRRGFFHPSTENLETEYEHPSTLTSHHVFTSVFNYPTTHSKDSSRPSIDGFELEVIQKLDTDRHQPKHIEENEPSPSPSSAGHWLA